MSGFTSGIVIGAAWAVAIFLLFSFFLMDMEWLFAEGGDSVFLRVLVFFFWVLGTGATVTSVYGDD